MSTNWLRGAVLGTLLMCGSSGRADAIQVTTNPPCFDVVTQVPGVACPAADKPLIVGTTRRLRVDILNDEGAPTSVSGPVSAPFVVCVEASKVAGCTSPFPLAIGTGMTGTFYVEYQPTAAGSHPAAITLTSTGGIATLQARGSAVILDLMLLFDNSGSMQWFPDGTDPGINNHPNARLRFAKDAANQLVSILTTLNIGTGLQTGACIFNYSGPPGADLACTQNLGPFAAGSMTTAIGNVGIVWDGTQMGRGLQAALSRLRDPAGPDPLVSPAAARCRPDHRCAIVMLSNGAHNQGIDPAGLLVSQAFKLYAVGYGSMRDVDPGRLQALVTESGVLPADGFRHYDPLSAATQLDTFFNKILKSLGMYEPAVDPRATISPGQTQTHDVPVVDLDHRAQFVISWETGPRSGLFFDLLDPQGAVVDPAVAQKDEDVDFVMGSSYMVYGIREGYLGRPNKRGIWKMRVQYGSAPPRVPLAAAVVVDTPPLTYSYSAFMPSDLEVHVAFDKSAYSTGDPILLAATVTANGVPLRGSAVSRIEAPLDRPNQGIGTWHAENAAQPQWIASIPAVRSGEPISAAQRKGLAVTLVGGIALPTHATVPALVFTDDGLNGDALKNDGIYTARFTDTSKPDTYTFHVAATGMTPGGFAFRRENLVQQFIPVNVVADPATSPLTFQVIDVVRGTRHVRVQVVPKDRFANFLGPDHAAVIDFQATSGAWLTPIQDDLRGGYSRVLEVAGGQDPDVTVSVDGKNFPTTNVNSAVRPRLEVGLFAGRFFIDDDLSISDGPVFGVRVGRPLPRNLTVEGELAVTPTTDLSGNTGRVIQALGSLRWDASAFGAVTPFLTAGFGVLNFTGFPVTDSGPVVQFGGGVLVPVNSRARLRLDARELLGIDIFGTHSENFQLTAGVVIGF